QTKIFSLPLSGSASGMNIAISTALSADSGVLESPVSLPINISIAKNGLTNNISDLGITKIKLVYSYNTNLLTLIDGDGAIASAYIPANGWTLSQPSGV